MQVFEVDARVVQCVVRLPEKLDTAVRMRILERILIQMICAIRVHEEERADGLLYAAGPSPERIAVDIQEMKLLIGQNH